MATDKERIQKLESDIQELTKKVKSLEQLCRALQSYHY